MHEYTPTNIWFASEEHSRSLIKSWALEDIGCLSLQDGLVTFQGARIAFQVSDVQDVQLVSQTISLSSLVINFILWFCVFSSSDFPLSAVVLSAICTAIIMVSLRFAIKWVRVEYQVDEEESSAVWFADGGKFGWAGILGGTQKLYEIVRSAVLTRDLAGFQPVRLGTPPVYLSVPVEQECPYCEETVIPVDGNRCPACDRPM